MLALAAAYLGFFAGMIFWSMVLRWIGALAVVLEKRWTYRERPMRQRTLLWAFPIVLLLHSGPWAIATLSLLAFHILCTRHATEWDWFFGGFAAGVGIMLCVAAAIVVRWRRAQAARFTTPPVIGNTNAA